MVWALGEILQAVELRADQKGTSLTAWLRRGGWGHNLWCGF